MASVAGAQVKVVWQAPQVRRGLLLDVSGVLPGSGASQHGPESQNWAQRPVCDASDASPVRRTLPSLGPDD